MLCRAQPNLSERKGQPAHSPGQSEAAPWVFCHPGFSCSPCKGKSVIYNDVTWGNQYDNRSGLYAFALTGRGFPRCTRLPRVSLRLPWAKRSLGFQPVALDGPIVPDFFTSNWTPYQLCSRLSMNACKKIAPQTRVLIS